MKNWFKKNKWEALVIFIIIASALLLRFYKISGYMTFLGDEGRDALVIQGILVNHHLPLLGPPTSVGSMYLGPLYYYMMAVPMAIFWLNPVAAAGMDAVIGVAAVVLIYYLARSWFGKWAAILSASLYAISPVNIVYSRSSWNPNPAPFFALLAMTGLYKAKQTKDFKWFILTGGALAFAVQMHYLALILLPVFGLLYLYELVIRKREALRNFWAGTFGAVAAFLILMSPLVLFDLRHNFVNYRALRILLSSSSGGVGFNPVDTLTRLLPIYNGVLVHDYLAGSNSVLSAIISILILIPLVFFVSSTIKNKKINFHFLALGIWLLVGLVGLSFYKNAIYDHYLGFMNPVPYLLLGGVIYFIKDRWRLVIGCLLLIIIGTFNILKSPLQYPPNNQLQRTQDIASFVIDQSDGKPFNFALISEHNYDSAYQFYLGRFGDPPKKVPFQITDQLFVVCEDPVCQPINNPKYEIAGFGLAKVVNIQDFDGVKVYKLVANPGGKPQ